MKHRRSIDLTQAEALEHDLSFFSMSRLREWHTIGGRCSRCEREGWIDRYDLERRYGENTSLEAMRPFLRCRRCGNKGSNKWIFGTMPR